MALRQLHKRCLDVIAENARQEAERAADASAEAKRPARQGTAPAKSKNINPGASVKKQFSSPRAAHVASYQDRATLSAYYNVMHAVGATSEDYRGGRVVLRFVIC